jgi:hypothetical protein
MLTCRQQSFLCGSFAAIVCIVAASVASANAAQRYDQYINRQTGVVRPPEGFATNDDCWRTSWVYASLVVIRANDQQLYERLKADHGLDISLVKTFLTYFRDNCIGGDAWKRPTTLTPDFSRDQLTPLLYLLACIHVHGPDDCRPAAKDILQDLVRIVKKRGAVSNTSGGNVDGNLRYVIDVVAHKFGVDFVGGTLRGIHKALFSGALKASMSHHADVPESAHRVLP